MKKYAIKPIKTPFIKTQGAKKDIQYIPQMLSLANADTPSHTHQPCALKFCIITESVGELPNNN